MIAFVQDSFRALESEKETLNNKQRVLKERVAGNKREELRLNALSKRIDEMETRVRQESLSLLLAQQAENIVQVEESVSPIRQLDDHEMRARLHSDRLAF